MNFPFLSKVGKNSETFLFLGTPTFGRKLWELSAGCVSLFSLVRVRRSNPSGMGFWFLLAGSG